MTMHEKLAGIDVSKAWLDVALSDRTDTLRFGNDIEGCAMLATLLDGVGLVVVEATGGYEMMVVKQLMAAGIGVAVVNPRQMRDFARASGRLAKTDRLDAQVILHFARTMHPAAIPPLNDHRMALAALVARRRQLVDMAVAEKNRLEHAAPAIAALVRQSIDFLKAQLAGVDVSIALAIEADPGMAHRRDLLLSVPGIGETSAAVLIAELPELGDIGDKQVAALVGVAPVAHDSGLMRGQRHIAGGRAPVRCALYMVTLSTIRCSPTIKAFYKRLRDAGKRPKVAIVAAMRKLITMINIIIRRDTPWIEKHGC